MSQETTALAYAKAFMVISDGQSGDRGVDGAHELTKINDLINTSDELEQVFFLEGFDPEEKQAVFDELAKKIDLSQSAAEFVRFLIKEKRLPLFPSIYKNVMVFDDHKKGFIKGVIEGAEPKLEEKIKNELLELLKKQLDAQVNLDYQQTSKVTAGYRVTVEDLQLDATVDNQLERFKQSVLGE